VRLLAFLIAGSAVWLALSGSAVADNGPHVQGAGVVTDSCAGCHRVHTAQAENLLVQSESALCFTCHGSSGTGAATDVVDGLGYSSAARTGTPGALRGGGFSFALINSANPSGQQSSGSNTSGTVPVLATGAATTSTHSYSGADVRAWGNGAIASGAGPTIQLRCASCHDPHGNGNYRILRGIPLQSNATPAVSIADAGTKVYTTTNYWSVSDSNGPSFIANVSAWCSTCHTRYLAGAGSGDTPSGDPIFAYRHRSNETSQGTTTCAQCHVAHGSNASMSGSYSSNVPFPDGSAGGSGSRLLRINNRGTCQMCHNR